jgi:uncharacterized protein YjbI with pentapeptide repeats
MRGANLAGAMMDFSNLVNVDMTGALTDQPAGKTLAELPMPLDQMIAFHKTWLTSEGREGQRLDLSGFDLRGAPPIFSQANLTMFQAEKTVWYAQDLTRAVMPAARFGQSDLRSCLLNDADLRGADFVKANLAGAKLRRARFDPLTLEKSNRHLKTDFTGANLRYTDFTGANLRGINFTEADLSYADFTDTDLEEARFDKAILEETKGNTGPFHT